MKFLSQQLTKSFRHRPNQKDNKLFIVGFTVILGILAIVLIALMHNRTDYVDAGIDLEVYKQKNW